MPGGALFGDTLDLLDRIGVDTAPLRADSRSLLFPGEQMTLVTMRPSDVPTYVEAGAVDLGITGKDVLMEQHERVVYELLDLGYGHCRMVVATRAGDHFAESWSAASVRCGSRRSTRGSRRATSRTPAARPR